MLPDPFYVRERRPTIRVERELVTDPERRLQSVLRRQELRAAGLCINGPRDGTRGRFGAEHGAPDPVSGKCERCAEVARRSR